MNEYLAIIEYPDGYVGCVHTFTYGTLLKKIVRYIADHLSINIDSDIYDCDLDIDIVVEYIHRHNCHVKAIYYPDYNYDDCQVVIEV